MNENIPFLTAGTASVFVAIEDSIQEGYAVRDELFKEHDALRNKGVAVTQEHRDKWHKPYAEWVNKTYKKLIKLFTYSNYAKEFANAPRLQNSWGRPNEDKIFTSIVDNQLYMIQKLEQFRNRIWQKSTLIINNSGQLNFQVGNDNKNEQSK